MPKHSNLTVTDGVHIIHSYVYANATARSGASGFLSADVGKVALQTDDLSFWALSNHSPATWVQLSGGGGGGEPGVPEANYPIGIQDINSCSLSWNNTTKTLSVSVKAPATSFVVIEASSTSVDTYTFTTTQSAIITTPAPGIWWFWFESGVLTTGTTLPSSGFKACIASLVYLDSTNNAIAVLDERHGPSMPWRTHQYLHSTVGTKFESGFGISRISSGTGADDGDAQAVLTGGIIWDEDIQCSIERTATPTTEFEQELGETPATPGQFPIYYRLGATGIWTKLAASNFIIYKDPLESRPSYNLFSSGTWDLETIESNNRLVVYYLCATNGLGNADGLGYLVEPVFLIMGQSNTSSTTVAENASFADLNLGTFFTQEIKPLYKIVLRVSTAYANSVKAYVFSITDLRNVSPIPATAYVATDHQSLSGRTVEGSHPSSAISVDTTSFTTNLSIADDTVQKALETLDAVGGLTLEDIQIPVIAGNQSTNLGVYTRLGGFIFNTTTAPATAYNLKLAAQSDNSNEFSIRLYDITAAAYVAGTITSTVSDLTILSLASLTLGSGERLYEVHAKLNAGDGGDDFLRVPVAFLEVIR